MNSITNCAIIDEMNEEELMKNNFVNNIQNSIKEIKEETIQRIEEIYNSIPNGQCVSACANCCMESVETHYIEFLRIYQYLKMRPELRNELYPKVLRFYFYELYQKRSCPFLNNDNLCSIYEVRPLPCRIYGTRNEQDYEKSYQRIKLQCKQDAKLLKKQFQVEISNQVLEYKVPYCTDFIIREADRISEENLQLLNDHLVTMQFPYFLNGYIEIDEIQYSLIGWFMRLWFTEEKMGELRIKILKELQETGKSETFEQLLGSLGSDGYEAMEKVFSTL